ncbi:methyltransferase domain-containing protein [Achromobacter xylosoxidans]|uniref:methyltransferase domain-containing protein n=1 Tax=Alcaligenes xylosoxydans xylosoxydans TaxID=85698 RepID=UPI0022B8B337|nr:methyltransferase domain-containing protein [Achromobacter xylosoxidans]MCZ8391018.1 methyltransferase domain-containing protein [Achromobacter xylosoxidans]
MCNAWSIAWVKQAQPHVKRGARLLAVGSNDSHATLRAIFSDPEGEYVGIGDSVGSDVDLVLDPSRIASQFGSQSFDAVVFFGMLEHCYDWQDALYQAAAALRIGGVMVLTARSVGDDSHDAVAGHWRFSREDFVNIFSPLGDVISVGGEVTQGGGACRVGVIVRRMCSTQALEAWAEGLRALCLDSVAEEADIKAVRGGLNKAAGYPGSNEMIFDQYSRYLACARLLRDAGLKPGSTVLDVGSGPECLLGGFIEEADVTYVDPLLAGNEGPNKVSGNVFVDTLNGKKYDFVCAVDVLEHVPPQYRDAFLARLMDLAETTVLLGFPPEEGGHALATDNCVNDEYRRVHGETYSWLHEHTEYGLPSARKVEEDFRARGYSPSVVGHGHTPWLNRLLSKVICYWDVQALKPEVLAASAAFNRELAEQDFASPHYRVFVSASKTPSSASAQRYEPTSDVQAILDQKFDEIARHLDESVLTKAVRELKRKEAEVAKLSGEVHLTSVWAQSTAETVRERDTEIRRLQQELEALTLADVDPRDAEIQRLHGELNELSQMHQRGSVRLGVRLLKAAARRRLAATPVGDVVRLARSHKAKQQAQVKLDAVAQAVMRKNQRLVLAFPIINWDFRWQRPQHLVSRLRDHGYAACYLSMNLQPLGRKFVSATEAAVALGVDELDQDIFQVRLQSRDPINVYVNTIAGEDLENLVTSLSELIRQAKPASIHYLVQFPGWWPVAQRLKEAFGGTVVFDCMDDHAGFCTNTSDALKMEQKLIEEADLVVASSLLLEDRCHILNPRTVQIKNGTEFEHFAEPKRNGLLDAYADRPIVGYYGAISDWFDMELVAHCARAKPEWNFVLIGSTMGADLAPVQGLSNVHLLGEKPYAELPGYFAYFDVCTIPFKLMPLTLATNPVKFYEYLSAGKPVVSIELPELAPYADDCYLAHNGKEFVAQLEKAMAQKDDQEKIARRIALAKKNSWDARVAELLHTEAFTKR